MNRNALWGCLCLALLLFFAAGCGTIQRQASSSARPTPLFQPPTAAPTRPPAPTVDPMAALASATSPEPTPTAACVDNLAFVQDVTIPDGTEVEPLSTLDKRWEVENSGNCGWNEHYRMRLIAGPDLNAQPEQALYPARSGSRAVLRVLFQAPEEPGTYKSAWQAINPQGDPFGDPFFIVIIVIKP